MNQSPALVLAVDIPSGVDGATGAVPGPAVRADATVTFQAAKPGHVLAPGSDLVGRLEVADIGLPLEPGPWGITEAADVAGLVPVPRRELHKRSRGVLLAVGGSSGMGGAPTLVGLGARRAGTGLLVLAVPASVADRVGAAVPEALTVHLPEADGGITPDAVHACKRWLDEATALAVGPGLGRSPATGEAVRALLASFERPAVVDADALYALGTGAPLAERQAPTLLTPHAGEFARLAPDTRGTRLHQALDRARHWGATVLLKGNHTVIADRDGRLAVNPTGVPALATGGTGDVLTGATGALLAQGLEPFDAGRLGAWVHGRAGALAAREPGSRSTWTRWRTMPARWPPRSLRPGCWPWSRPTPMGTAPCRWPAPRSRPGPRSSASPSSRRRSRCAPPGSRPRSWSSPSPTRRRRTRAPSRGSR